MGCQKPQGIGGKGRQCTEPLVLDASAALQYGVADASVDKQLVREKMI